MAQGERIREILKQDQYKDAQNQIKAEEDRKYEKEKELEELIEEMQDEADIMAFEEHAFMKPGVSEREERTSGRSGCRYGTDPV